MNVRRRGTEGGLSGVSASGKAAKNAANQMQVTNNKPQAIKNALGLKPTGGGIKKIKGAQSGPGGRG